MFFLAYLRSELLRRRARTILTLLGLALGVALVIAIAALSRGLDRAQESVLDPLSSIGTDLTVTRAPDDAAVGPRGGAAAFAAMRSVSTDLSKLGEPGEKFVHDFFLPGTQLPLEPDTAARIAELPGVADVAQGLTLLAVHQEGTVPEIVARIQTGGREFRIDRRIEPLTDAERVEVQACIERNGGGAVPAPAPRGERGSGGARLQLGPLGECLPERFRRFRETFVTPRETLEQVLDPPQTDIESEPYTVAGVNAAKPGMGLVTPQQVTSGRFLRAGEQEALLSAAYARRRSIEVGGTLNLNGKRFAVVGLVEPPLGGQAADVYLPLGHLQELAGDVGGTNVVLVRADSNADVAAVERAIEETIAGAEVASADQVADTITGSLVDAADLSRTLGVALSVAAALAAFLLAALLTLSSVGKRVRELGTLKALGWSQRLVVRQVVGESLAQGVVGGLVGVGLGLAAAWAVGELGPTLSASAATGGGGGLFGLGEVPARDVTSEVALTAPAGGAILVLGFGLAVLGGLVAGAAGALRAARLRPAEALRRVD